MNPFHVAFIAMATFITEALKAKPVTINDNGNLYEVNGVNTEGETPLFECRALDGSGGTLAGGLQRLPVDEHYCALVLLQVEWTAAQQTKARGDEKALAVGAGASAGAPGGIGGGTTGTTGTQS